MRSIVISAVLVGGVIFLAILGWLVLIKIDANADDARIVRGEVPTQDDRTGLGRWLYLRALRKAAAQRELRARRQQQATVRHGGERRRGIQ